MAARKKSSPQTGEQYELGMASLEESGLTQKDAEALGIKFLSGSETAALAKGFEPLPSLYIPYWHPFDQAKPLSYLPHGKQFFRIRYLKKKSVKEFGDLAKKKKEAKYMQPYDSGICAYFPRGLNWLDICQNTAIPVIITEGEKKSAKACKEGFPTIGLGGVHSFRSAKEGVFFLNELAAVKWPGRTVYICYDSDYTTNDNICFAINSLAEELTYRGARPHVLPLPNLESGDRKTGLDDFLVAEGRTGLEAIIEQNSQLLGIVQPLIELNQKVVFVKNPGLIIDLDSGQKLTTGQFKDGFAFDERYAARTVKPGGGVSMEMVAAGPVWMRWPLKNKVDTLVYAPGKPVKVELLNGVTRYAHNTWTGWGIEPREGDPFMFLTLIDHLFKGAEPEAKTWFLRWLAYPLQHPGVKMFSAAVIHGKAHGSGKSLIGYTMMRIYGKNFTEIKDKDLHGNFNEWAENKQFILGDDVTGSDKRTDNDVLKKLITQKEMRINTKFIPSYVIQDVINYLFTSNQPDSFFLEDDDRRFFIHEVIVAPKSEEFYADYDLWIDSKDGAPTVFHYLLNLDLGDFNPAAPAFATKAKLRMTADVQSDLGTWVRRLMVDPDSTLRLGAAVIKQDLFTNKELKNIYDPEGRTRVTGNGMGRELTRAGIRQVLEGSPVKTPHGLDRVYAIRNSEKWLKASREQIVAYLSKIEPNRNY